MAPSGLSNYEQGTSKHGEKGLKSKLGDAVYNPQKERSRADKNLLNNGKQSSTETNTGVSTGNYFDDSITKNFLNRAAIQESSMGTSLTKSTGNGVYNLDGPNSNNKLTDVTGEQDMLNIVIPARGDNFMMNPANAVIRKLVDRVTPQECSMCQLARGLEELDILVQQNIDPRTLLPQGKSNKNKYLDPNYLTEK